MGNREMTNQITIQRWEDLVSELRHAAEQKSITQEMIAERTGLIQSNISRLFALKYQPNIKTLLLVASAVGVNLKLEETEALR